MFSFSKINIFRITSVFLLSFTLFFGSVSMGNLNAVAAEAITRDVTNAMSDAPLKDEAYDAMKAGRQNEQARRSEMATPDKEGEGIVEKLNLNEDLPPSTEEFIDGITGESN